MEKTFEMRFLMRGSVFQTVEIQDPSRYTPEDILEMLNNGDAYEQPQDDGAFHIVRSHVGESELLAVVTEQEDDLDWENYERFER